MASRLRWFLLSGLLAALLPSSACQRSAKANGAGTPAAAANGASGGAPIVTIDGRAPLLLTYADRDGTFHTATASADVPDYARAVVRVVDPSVPPDPGASPDRIYVVDLRRPDSNGRYPVRPFSRAAFEDAALSAVASTRGEILPPESPPLPAGGPQAGASGPGAPQGAVGGGASDPGGGPVIIYGASWCGACEAAKRYLSSKHVPFIEKDIERDSGAAEEMAAKADRAGLPTGSIPMIDVHGRMVVGFNPVQLDALLGEHL